MRQPIKRLIYCLFTSSCALFSGCISVSVRSSWSDLQHALPAQCQEVSIPEDAIAAEQFKFGKQRHYLAIRQRNGSRRVLSVRHAEGLYSPDFDESSQVEFTGDNEVIAFVDDVMAIFTMARDGQFTEFRVLATGGKEDLIARLQLGHGELVTSAANDRQIAMLYREYLESGDRYHLIHLKYEDGAKQWKSEEKTISATKLIPIKFTTDQFLGFAALENGKNGQMWIFQIVSGQLLALELDPKSIARIVSPGTTEIFATLHRDSLFIGSMKPSESYDGASFEIVELSSKAAGMTYFLSKDYSMLNQGIESSGASILLPDGRLHLVMGNWLDLERTVGTYTPSDDGSLLAGNRRVFGVFPENAHFEDFQLTEPSTFSWTVRTKLNHGWKFDRCRIEK
jgi:hypothetical protein